MRIKFTGKIKAPKTGCGCSGGSGSGVSKFRTYHLPSGGMKTFVAGQITEVSDDDGNFLLETEDALFEKVN